MFLTDENFREHHGNAPPVMIWINLNSKEEVDELYELWKAAEVKSSPLWNQSLGSCTNSLPPTRTAISSVCFTISPETPDV